MRYAFTVARQPGKETGTVWRFLLPIVFSIAVCCMPGRVEAHGGGPGLDYDPCVRPAGDGFVHMAVYQPGFNRFAEYCSTLPQSGATLLVFDLMGVELSDASISLTLMRQGGSFHLSVPPRHYRSGVADLRADLPAGKYLVLVNIEDIDWATSPGLYAVGGELVGSAGHACGNQLVDCAGHGCVL